MAQHVGLPGATRCASSRKRTLDDDALDDDDGRHGLVASQERGPSWTRQRAGRLRRIVVVEGSSSSELIRASAVATVWSRASLVETLVAAAATTLDARDLARIAAVSREAYRARWPWPCPFLRSSKHPAPSAGDASSPSSPVHQTTFGARLASLERVSASAIARLAAALEPPKRRSRRLCCAQTTTTTPAASTDAPLGLLDALVGRPERAYRAALALSVVAHCSTTNRRTVATSTHAVARLVAHLGGVVVVVSARTCSNAVIDDATTYAPRLRSAAARALCQLAREHHCRAAIRAAGGVERLVSVVGCPPPADGDAAAPYAPSREDDTTTITRRRSSSSSSRRRTPHGHGRGHSTCGGPSSAVFSLTAADVEPRGRDKAAQAIANLAARDDDAKAAITRAGAVPALVALLRSHLDLQQQASRSTRSMITWPPPYHKTANLGRGAENAAAALSNLAADRRGAPSLDNDDDDAAAMPATGRAAHHLRCPKRLIVDAGALPLLARLLECGALRGRENAAGALANLAGGGFRGRREAAAEIVRSGAVPPLVKMVSAAEDGERVTERAREKAAAALRYLALDHRENRRVITACGALEPLVHLASAHHRATSAAASSASNANPIASSSVPAGAPESSAHHQGAHNHVSHQPSAAHQHHRPASSHAGPGGKARQHAAQAVHLLVADDDEALRAVLGMRGGASVLGGAFIAPPPVVDLLPPAGGGGPAGLLPQDP